MARSLFYMAKELIYRQNPVLDLISHAFGPGLTAVVAHPIQPGE